MPDFTKLKIKPTTYLVKNIPDYFSRKQVAGANFKVHEGEDFSQGIIEKVGDDLPPEEVGHVIYYQKNLADRLSVKGIGMYDLVPKDYMLMVRMDQNRNDY